MTEILVAIIGAVAVIAVARIEHSRKKIEETRDENRSDHAVVMSKIESLGKSLGISIDRVEGNLGEHIVRVENKVESVNNKLDEHLRDHAVGALIDSAFEPIERKRRKKKETT